MHPVVHLPRPRPLLAALAATALVVALSSCGDDDDGGGTDATIGQDVGGAAATGRDIALAKGCAACHGQDGEGGIGPAWTGLAGSEVELDDGTTIVADDTYLRRSIEDPSADVVADFAVQMPENGLSSEEIDAVIAYIRELS